MTRGDLVTVAAPGDYGTPRPAVIVQTDLLNDTHASIVVCLVTSIVLDAPLFRITIEKSEQNGLERRSQIMVDKLVSVRREKIGRRLGTVDEDTMLQLGRSLAFVLGLGT